jgi:sugar fermentation stimulation protein A
MTIARDIDPNYGEYLDKARKVGVEVIAFNCRLSPKAITVSKPVEFLG